MKLLKNIISESVSILLLEYDREKTMKNHGDKAYNVAINRTGEHSDSYLRDIHDIHHKIVRNHKGDNGPEAAKHELFSQFEESDPSPNKKYVQHIARIYGNGGVSRHEDIYARMKPALRKYDDLTKRKILPPEHRDIGRVKSLSDLEDIVDAHSDKLSNREQDAAHHEEMKKQATITEHGAFTHIIPHTVESAAHFGKGTKWCTATEDPDDSMFNHYNSHGKLHIIAPKQPKYTGEKYQIHLASEDDGMGRGVESLDDAQVMNEKDQHAVHDFETNHPEAHSYMSQYLDRAHNASNTRDGLRHQEPWVVNQTLNRAKDFNDQDKEYLLNHDSVNVRLHAEGSKAVGLPDDDDRPYRTMTNFLNDNKNDPLRPFHDITHDLHPRHAEAMLDWKHPDPSYKHAEREEKDVNYSGAWSEHLPQHRLDELHKNSNEDLRYAAARHSRTKDEHLDILSKDKSKSVADAAKETIEARAKAKKAKSLKSIINRNPTLN